MEDIRLPSDPAMMLIIARRGAVEALRDRMTLFMSGAFALILPTCIVLAFIRPAAPDLLAGGHEGALGSLLAFYLLVVGMFPSSAAIGIASGQFAGEKEKGNLAPILASPASNVAIFGGKVLGAIVPAMVFSLVAEVAYLVSVALLVGASSLCLLPIGLSVAMLALVPAFGFFAAMIASLISSRVRTYNAAQQISGLVLVPVWGGFSILAFAMRAWGSWALLAVVAAMVAANTLLMLLSAATWRREEVLAHQ
jgi:ABC-type Na+ efflux pump permease subunit